MQVKFKIFTGNHKQVEADFNRFLQTEDGTYSNIVMTGTAENLVLGVAYTEADKSVKMYF